MRRNIFIAVIIFLIGSTFIAFAFARYVELPFEFDFVHTNDSFNFGATREGRVRIHAHGREQWRKLGLYQTRSGPFRIRVCTNRENKDDLVLKNAHLTHVVDGQLVPVDVDFNFERSWVLLVEGVDRFCLEDILHLDVEIEIESREFYCFDLILDRRGSEEIERKCLRFWREPGVYKSTILGLILGV